MVFSTLNCLVPEMLYINKLDLTSVVMSSNLGYFSRILNQVASIFLQQTGIFVLISLNEYVDLNLLSSTLQLLI